MYYVHACMDGEFCLFVQGQSKVQLVLALLNIFILSWLFLYLISFNHLSVFILWQICPPPPL